MRKRGTGDGRPRFKTTTTKLVQTRTKRSRTTKPRKRMSPAKLPGKLRSIRERAGLTQDELAVKIGIKHRASISGYERGDREPPLPVLLNYARLAGVNLEFLVDDALELPAEKKKKLE